MPIGCTMAILDGGVETSGEDGMHALRAPPFLLARLILAGFVAGASLFLIAPGPLSAHTAGATLPTLRLGWYSAGTDVRTLDPGGLAETPDSETVALVNANLVHLLPNGKVAPDLATWTISRSNLVYTFTIRKNARFSNGHYVTAADVAFSIERAIAPGLRLAIGYLNLIQGAAEFNAGTSAVLPGVKVVGVRVVQISILKPAAYFLAALALPTADVLDPSVVSGQPIYTFLTGTCSGNQGAGPFMFVCRNRGSQGSFYPPGQRPIYTLIPNPYYYGRKPTFRIQLPL